MGACVTRRCSAHVAYEVPVQVGLVVESHGGGDVGGSVAGKEKLSCLVDALPGEVGGVGVQDGGGFAQGHADACPGVQ